MMIAMTLTMMMFMWQMPMAMSMGMRSRVLLLLCPPAAIQSLMAPLVSSPLASALAVGVSAFAPSCNCKDFSHGRGTKKLLLCSSRMLRNHRIRVRHSRDQPLPPLQPTRWPGTRVAPLAATPSTTTSKCVAASDDGTPSSEARLPLAQVLRALDERNVRYAPNATRAQLEEQLEALQPPLPSPLPSPSQSSIHHGQEATAVPHEKGVVVDAVDAVVVEVGVSRQETPGVDGSQTGDHSRQKGRRRDHGHESATRWSGEGGPSMSGERRHRRQPDHRRQPIRTGYDEFYSDSGQPQQPRSRRGRRQANSPDGDPGEQRRRWQNYDGDGRRPRQYRTSPGSSERARRASDDVIDLDTFRISNIVDNDEPNDYENGMEIFLMGFAEAGRTAARLAVDTINPFHSDDDREDGNDWWYDEELGRRVLDREVLEYSPSPPEGGWNGRQYYEERRGERRDQVEFDSEPPSPQPRRRRDVMRRMRRGGSTRPPRMRPHRRRQTVDRERREHNGDMSPSANRSKTAASANYNTAAVEGGEESSTVTVNGISPGTPECNNTPRQRRGRSRRGFDEGDANDNYRPIYGLYHGNSYSEEPSAEEGADAPPCREDIRDGDKQQWRDRLRHKFDTALGLQAPSSSASEGSPYYDSWKSKMEDLDQARAGAAARHGRQPQPSQDDAQAADLESWRMAEPSPKENRRARMRKKSKLPEDIRKPPPQARPLPPSGGSSPPLYNNAENKYRGNMYFQRSQLDEFWREGGALASLLFNTRLPPAAKNGDRKMGKMTLEQLLQSPFGCQNTVTSLFLYVSRMGIATLAMICRWAGVRGTIPQPIVVAAVVAALAGSRRRGRASALGMTVLALRLVGEFLQGSLIGNEFWDDECDSEERTWKDGSVY